MKSQIVDGVLETRYDDKDISDAHAASLPVPVDEDTPSFSKAILDMVKKMKRGSCKRNNARSRKIVKALRIEHDRKFGNGTQPIATPSQKSIFDY